MNFLTRQLAGFFIDLITGVEIYLYSILILWQKFYIENTDLQVLPKLRVKNP